MKLAQALNKRKALKQCIDSQVSIVSSLTMKYPGDPEPTMTCGQALAQLFSLRKAYVDLIKQIEATNFSTQIPGGLTIAQALVARDVAKDMHKKLSSLMVTPPRQRTVGDRYAGNQTVETGVLMLDLAEVQRMANQASAEWRALDDAIQQANWTTDINE